MVVLYTTWHMEPGGPVSDTANSFIVGDFQPATTVYFYNIHGTLMDSVITSVGGDGTVLLQNALNDSILYDPVEMTWGLATNGVCSTKVGGVGLLPARITRFTVTGLGNNITIQWDTEADEPGTTFIIQQSDDGYGFRDIKTIVSTSSNTGRYSYTGLLFFDKTKYFRIKTVSRSQQVSYSPVKVIHADAAGDILISVGPLRKVSVRVPDNFINGYYALYNEAGSLLYHGNIFSSSFILSSKTGNGVYFVRVSDRNGRRITKSFIIPE